MDIQKLFNVLETNRLREIADSLRNDVKQLDYSVYNLQLQSYYDGKIMPKTAGTALFFDGFSDTLKRDASTTSTIDTANKVMKASGLSSSYKSNKETYPDTLRSGTFWMTVKPSMGDYAKVQMVAGATTITSTKGIGVVANSKIFIYDLITGAWELATISAVTKLQGATTAVQYTLTSALKNTYTADQGVFYRYDFKPQLSLRSDGTEVFTEMTIKSIRRDSSTGYYELECSYYDATGGTSSIIKIDSTRSQLTIQNLLTANQSNLEAGLTGWTAGSTNNQHSTGTSGSTVFGTGANSGKVTSAYAAGTQSIWFSTPQITGLTANTDYCFSIWVKQDGNASTVKFNATLYFYSTAGAYLNVASQNLNILPEGNGWSRIFVSGRTPATSDRLYMDVSASNVANGVSLFIDGAQFEAGLYPNDWVTGGTSLAVDANVYRYGLALSKE